MDEVARRGLDAALDEAVARASRGTAGFGLSLDIDALDPAAAPAVAVSVADGLAPLAVMRGIRAAAALSGCCGFELVEYNPTLDRNGATRRIVESTLRAFVGAS